MLKNSLLLTGLLALGLMSDALAAGPNLVQNGGFDTLVGGMPADWTFGPASYGSDWYISSYAHSADYSVAFGAVGAYDDTFSQVIPVIAGQLYDVGFWLATSYSGYGTDLNVQLGSTSIAQLINPPSYMGWTYYEYDQVVATGNNLTFRVGGRDVPSWIYLDDVSVRAVPEGGCTAVLLGLSGLGLAIFRRKDRY